MNDTYSQTETNVGRVVVVTPKISIIINSKMNIGYGGFFKFLLHLFNENLQFLLPFQFVLL